MKHSFLTVTSLVALLLTMNVWAGGAESALVISNVPEKPASNGESAATIPVVEEVTHADETMPVSLLNEIVVTQNQNILARFADKKQLLLRYRPSENMPEMTSPLVLEGLGDKNAMERINQGKDKVGTIPRLVLLPCKDGCVNNRDYEKAAAAFQKNYDAPVKAGLYGYRGQIKVKVRWFQQRGVFERALPIPTKKDVFAISFLLEGKLITLSKYSFGRDNEMDMFTTRTSGLLGLTLATEIGAGIKPYFLQFLLPEHERGMIVKVNDGLAPIVKGLNQMVGGFDYGSRIEPMSEEFSELLPAVDGILPNEISPIKGPVFYNHI